MKLIKIHLMALLCIAPSLTQTTCAHLTSTSKPFLHAVVAGWAAAIIHASTHLGSILVENDNNDISFDKNLENFIEDRFAIRACLGVVSSALIFESLNYFFPNKLNPSLSIPLCFITALAPFYFFSKNKPIETSKVIVPSFLLGAPMLIALAFLTQGKSQGEYPRKKVNHAKNLQLLKIIYIKPF